MKIRNLKMKMRNLMMMIIQLYQIINRIHVKIRDILNYVLEQVKFMVDT